MQVIPLKVLDENGEGWDEDVALAIRRAADLGARVINLSMGGRGGTVLSEAVAYARAKGCVLVAAAGNSGLDEVLYPAGTPGVIGVASVDSQLRQAMFSNSGPHVDVCAPGEQVFSTAWPSAFGSGGELYGYMSGTSMATPFVTAEAALLFSAKPTATGPQVENAILASAKDLGPAGRDDDYGRGLIDAAKALSVLVGYDYTPPKTIASGVFDRMGCERRDPVTVGDRRSFGRRIDIRAVGWRLGEPLHGTDAVLQRGRDLGRVLVGRPRGQPGDREDSDHPDRQDSAAHHNRRGLPLRRLGDHQARRR